MTEAPTVLVVDDNTDIRDLLRLRLQAIGCGVVEADSAAEGIVAATLARPDVIVLDWQLPDITGLEALPAFRRAAPRSRILMFSSRPADEAASAALAAGADGYFEKSRAADLILALSDTRVDAAGERTAPAAGAGDEDRDGSRPVPNERSFRVLVVEDDALPRALLCVALELEGAVVIESGSIADAEAALEDRFDGVILNRRLPDGDGLDLLPLISRRVPAARVVVCSDMEDDPAPAWVLHIPKANTEAVVAGLGLGTVPSAAGEPFDAPADALLTRWRSRCRLAGLNDLGSLAEGVIRALTAPPRRVAAADDEELTRRLAACAPESVPIEDVLRQLHCLREILLANIAADPPRPGHLDAVSTINHLIDQVAAAVVVRSAERLREEAFTDSLTGLLNRRAFDAAFHAELPRATRYQRPFSLVMIDLDGLKYINDNGGHAAGDAALRAMADALQHSVRATDSAYRLGGDEFVMLLPETPKRHLGVIIERVLAAGPPAFSWGAATFLEDTEDGLDVIALADHQLIERRREIRGG